MEILTDDKKKIVEIWLTRAERADAQTRLKALYAAYKEQKYTVAVYESGEGDLLDCTRELLCYNHSNLCTGSTRNAETRGLLRSGRSSARSV